jgi:cell division protein FtsQ
MRRAKPRTKPPTPRRAWRRRIGVLAQRRWLVGGALVVGTIGALALARAQDEAIASFLSRAREEARQTWLDSSARAGLNIQQIFVEGRHETSAGAVVAATGIVRGAPILAIDPAEARAALEKLPWVASASIERRLPDALFVRIVERGALAVWQRRGEMVVIDRLGVEIAGADARRFAMLPVVVGDDAPRHAEALIALMATEPELQRRIAAAVRVGGRRWNLRLDNGIDVLLPEENPGGAWTRLAELLRGPGFERDVRGVDLRLPDRLILRVDRQAPPPAVPATRPARARAGHLTTPATTTVRA